MREFGGDVLRILAGAGLAGPEADPVAALRGRGWRVGPEAGEDDAGRVRVVARGPDGRVRGEGVGGRELEATLAAIADAIAPGGQDRPGAARDRADR